MWRASRPQSRTVDLSAGEWTTVQFPLDSVLVAVEPEPVGEVVGQLVEEGTHEALLERDGLYADLWAVQVGEVDDLPDSFVERAADRERLLGGDD